MRVLEIENWSAPDITWLKEQVDLGNPKEGRKILQISKHNFSPVTIYALLKSKFGPPNGFAMYLRDNSSDNLIHWHYTIISETIIFQFLGKITGLEIIINSPKDFPIDENQLIEVLERLIKEYKKLINETLKTFEHWQLFINPFVRIQNTVRNLMSQINKIDLTPVTLEYDQNKEKQKIILRKYKAWIKKVDHAAVLGNTLRMVIPVYGEAFINMLILILCREEIREDDRLYSSFIKQQIDVRIKLLPINCYGFIRKVDGKSQQFKNFHTLMNLRNDFLHGNVDPTKLKFEEVYFDYKNVPLFTSNEPMFGRFFRSNLHNVHVRQAMDDLQVVETFIKYINTLINPEMLPKFHQFLNSRFPGLNTKTGGLGVLFPNTIVDFGVV